MDGKWKEWHAWSRSRQLMLDECPRSFYYRYVKFYDMPYGDILKATKRMLDQMTNTKFLLGSVVHEAIERQFDQLSRGREIQGPDSALQYVTRVMSDIKYNPEKHVIEALNGKEISDAELSKIEEEAKRQVNVFFKEFFDFYKDLEIITHEDYCNIEIDGHKFYLMPDLITKSSDGRVYVTDWKSDSTYSAEPNERQMKMYILWALQKGHADFIDLRAEVIFLDIGDSKEYITTEEDLDSFKEELVENSEKLFEYIDSRSGEEDFERCEEEEVCFSCGFKSYCETN
ncbi:PD-(D/E)XK nuclease family protein [archaeon]|nr:PD-(D/E)XK nuclease family protein [archaeon]